jgi:hypothetical protein
VSPQFFPGNTQNRDVFMRGMIIMNFITLFPANRFIWSYNKNYGRQEINVLMYTIGFAGSYNSARWSIQPV